MSTNVVLPGGGLVGRLPTVVTRPPAQRTFDREPFKQLIGHELYDDGVDIHDEVLALVIERTIDKTLDALHL